MTFLNKKTPWTRKQIRLVIGMMMASSFLVLVFQIDHLLTVFKYALEITDSPVILSSIMFNFFYITAYPTLILIGITYVLLMKVFPYQPKEKHSEEG